MFYDNFINLCAERMESPSGVAKKIGLSNAAANGWKNGKVPSEVTLTKLSKYFDVTTEYLLTGRPEKSPTTVGERLDDPAIYRIERARKKMSPAEKQKMMNILKASFEDYFSDDYEDDDLDE